jgi:hypothetical protein
MDMEKKLDLDLNEVEYDGGRIRLKIEKEPSFVDWLKQEQIAIIRDLEQQSIDSEHLKSS